MSEAVSSNVKVHHILADGREVDSIEGYVVPNSGETATVYRLVADLILSKRNARVKDENTAAGA